MRVMAARAMRSGMSAPCCISRISCTMLLAAARSLVLFATILMNVPSAVLSCMFCAPITCPIAMR